MRRRFSHDPRGADAVTYRGVMHKVECSIAGFLLAQALRLVGTPFAPWRGSDVPVTIALKADAPSGGIAWERLYRYPGRAPLLVRSVKQLALDGGLLECVQGGFGMRLRAAEIGRTLTFRSLRYFWRWAGWEATLPSFLTPGTAYVIHADLGGGRFRFRMTLRHPLLGVTFRQDGVFTDQGATDGN